MKPVTMNYANAVILIIAGLYGYFGISLASDTPSKTALIPAAFGILLIVLGLFWAKAPKVVSHIVVVLTLVLMIMCLTRFMKVADWEAKKFVFLVCVLSNAIALVVFIKSFIDVRRNRAA